MGEGNHAAETPVPSAEAHCDVSEDDDEGKDDGDDGVAPDVACDGSAHLVGGDDTVGVLQGLGEVCEGHILHEHSLQGLEEHSFDFSIHGRGLVFDLVGSGDLHLAVATELLHLHRRGLDVIVGCGSGVEHLVDSVTHVFSKHGLVEADHIGAATGEIDTIGKALGEDAGERDDNHDAGDDIRPLASAEEVDVCVLEEVLREVVLEGDVLALGHAAVDDEAGDEDGGEHRSDDTDDQGGGKSLDRAGTEEEEHETGEQGSDLAVDDGGVSVGITVRYSLAQALACLDLFLDALIDDNVGVHGHTQGQHETGDTGQGQNRAEGGEGAEEEHYVGEQCHIGHETCALVEEYHIEEHEDEGDEEGNHTVLDGLCTQ